MIIVNIIIIIIIITIIDNKQGDYEAPFGLK